MVNTFKLSVGAALLSTALVSALAPSASAFNFTPRETGEIDVGLGCITGQCLDVSSMFDSIVSLEDASSGNRSRLFVDYFGTGDTNAVFENDEEKVVFKTRDKGTNSAGYWFRPSEYNEFTKEAEEQGQLEVGTYQFNFAQTMAELSIDFFDTESFPTTGVLEINGVALDPADAYLAKGRDGNIQTMRFENVDSIVMKLGRDSPSGTGDGVNFRMSGTPVETPEPTVLLGLLVVAGSGATLKKRAQAVAS